LPEVDTGDPQSMSAPVGAAFSEGDFASMLRRHLQPFMAVKGLMERTVLGGDVARRAFASVQRLADEFVGFLDDHGARSNATYAPLAEYAACVRGFAKMGRHLAHVESRLGSELPVPAERGERLPEEVRRTLEFVKWSLANLQEEVFVEVGRLLGETTRPPTELARGEDKDPGLVLPSTLDEAVVPDTERWIAEVASNFLAHKQILDASSHYRSWTGAEEMSRFVLDVSDEQQVRFFSTRIHNVLSRYDTYIHGTAIERRDPDLLRFRSFVVMTLHVLEVMIELVHFYERHENDVRSETAKDRIAELVDKQVVLDRILNFCLNTLHVYMEDMVPLAEGLVERYTRRTSVVCSVPEGVELHARPVSLIARIVDHYGTPVQMTIGDTTCYAGSILQVLMAIGSNTDAREVTFEGDSKPLEDLRVLFDCGMGETETPLPKELAYLVR